MDTKMGEVVNSMLFERDNILKLIKEYENKLSELKEKLNSKVTPYNSNNCVEDLEIKYPIKHFKTSSMKVCRYFNRGYCRKREYCKYKHETKECSRHLEGQSCEAKFCYLRHRSSCKYWIQGFCFRGKGCAYLHRNCFKSSRSVEDQINVAVKESETSKAQNTTDNERDLLKVKEENIYFKRQISRLRDRNMKLDHKVMENGDKKIANDDIKVLESEIESLKERNDKLLKKIKEILQQRLELESEVDHLKQRLGEDNLEEESESD